MTVKTKRFFRIIALIAATAAGAQEGGGGVAVDTSKAVAAVAVDTSKKAVAVDTAKAVAVDTSQKAVVVDTAKSGGVDTSKKAAVVAVDTSQPAVAVDTSKKAAVVDTPKIAAVAVDTPKAVAVDAVAVDTSKKTALVDTPTVAAADTPEEVAGPARPAFAYAIHIIILAVSAAVIALTVRFFLARRDSRRFLTTTRLAVLDRSVQRGCRYVEANYGDPALSPEKVCKALVTGLAYLDALFMNELGINVRDFIIQVRVNAIKNALASPRLPDDLREVCVRCGFKDRAEAEVHFARICGGQGIAEYGRALKRG